MILHRGGSDRSPERSSWSMLWLALLALAAILPHATALRATDFAFDDRGLVSKNPRVWDASPIAVISTPYWPEQEDTGLYRPVTGLSYWMDGKIWGKEPFGFHLTNLFLHALVVLSLFSILGSLFPGMRAVAAIACLLFAVHPLHSEAVFAISGRAELLAALFGLLAYASARRFAEGGRGEHPVSSARGAAEPGFTAGRGSAAEPGFTAVGVIALIGSALLFGLATLSKESAIGLGLLLVFHALAARHGDRQTGIASVPEARKQTSRPGERSAHSSADVNSMETAAGSSRRWWIAACAWGAILVGILLLRASVLGSVVGLEQVSRTDNPLVDSPPLERIVTALGIQGWALGKLLAPIRLSADYSYAQIVPGTFWIALGLCVVMAGIAAAIYLWKRNDEPLRWGAALLVASGLLTANVIFAIGTVFGERLTYLPSAASLWGIAVLGARGFRGPLRVAGIALLAIYLLALSVRTGLRGADWENNVSLFRAASLASPRSVKVWTNLAFSLADQKQLEPALEAARRAEQIDPHYAGAHLALGSILNQLGRPADAMPYLRRADDLPGQRGFDATLELGNAYLLMNEGVRAESIFVAARAIGRTDPEERCLIGLASAQALQERWSESRASWSQAARRRPQDSAIRQRFAYALWQDGAIDSAEVAYREALGLQPGDASIRNDLAWFLVQTGRDSEEALELAEAAFTDAPTANTADTVLEARLAVSGCEGASRWVDSLRGGAEPEILDALVEKLAARCGTDGNGG